MCLGAFKRLTSDASKPSKNLRNPKGTKKLHVSTVARRFVSFVFSVTTLGRRAQARPRRSMAQLWRQLVELAEQAAERDTTSLRSLR